MANVNVVATQYTGPVTLNNRSIQTGLAFLKDNKRGKAVTSNEVSDLFNFLEAYILSNQIMFDGTVPSNAIQKTLNDSEILFQKGWLWRKKNYELKPITMDTNEKMLNLCGETVNQASQLMLNITGHDVSLAGLPQKDTEAFCSAFDLAEGLCVEDKKNLALDILSKNSFIGSKCVAGILAADMDENELYKPVSAQVLLAKNSPQQQSLLASQLVNRFRANYINAISANFNSAYVAHPAIESLKSQQTMLLWRYLGKKMNALSKSSLADLVQSNVAKEFDSFPYAYALIMHPDVDSVESLLEKADELRDSHFNKMALSEKESNQRYIHEMDAAAFEKLEDDLFRKTYLKIKSHDAPYKDFLYKTKRFQLPALIGASSAFSGVLFEDTMMAAAFELGLMSTVKGLDIGMKGYQQKKKLNMYRDHFNKWEILSKSAISLNVSGITLDSRLHDIFGVTKVVRL